MSMATQKPALRPNAKLRACKKSVRNEFSVNSVNKTVVEVVNSPYNTPPLDF